MTDSGAETRLVPVKGRTIVVKKLTEGQMLLMSRDAGRLEDDKLDVSTKLRVAGGILDMFESVIVQQEDRDYVLDLTRKGEVDLPDFLEFLTAFKQEEPQPKVVARRGRPRKAVTK
jgi:hypothetical protein